MSVPIEIVDAAKDVAFEKELTIDLFHFLYAQRNFWKSKNYAPVKNILEEMARESAFDSKFVDSEGVDEGSLDYYELTQRTMHVLSFKKKPDMSCLLSPQYKEHENFRDILFQLMCLSRDFNYTVFSFFLPYDIRQYYTYFHMGINPAYISKKIIIDKDNKSYSTFSQLNPPPTPIWNLTSFVPDATPSDTTVKIHYGFENEYSSVTIEPLSCDDDIMEKVMNTISTYVAIELMRNMEKKCINCVNCFKQTLQDDEVIGCYKEACQYLENKTAKDNNLQQALFYKLKIDKIYRGLKCNQRDYAMLEPLLRKSYRQRITGLLLYDIEHGYVSCSPSSDDNEIEKCQKKRIQILLDKEVPRNKRLWITNAEKCIDNMAIIPIKY